MRMMLGKGALALALCSILFVAGSALAANSVTVVVVDQNNTPVEGASVEVLGTDGATGYVTDQNGAIAADLNGEVFRVKVNGDILSGLHQVSEGTVTVELN
jgi:hypothetical protein